jgi:hypothetical protein
MDESVEVAPAPVTVRYAATEPLGITLARDLSIEELEPSVGADKGLKVGLVLQAVNDKTVVGFALDGVMAMIEKAKKPGEKLSLTFAPAPTPQLADTKDLSPMPKTGVSLPPGVDKSKIDFAALIKTGSTGSTPSPVEGGQRDTFVRMADAGSPVTVTFHQPGPLGIHFSDRLPLRIIKARGSTGAQPSSPPPRPAPAAPGPAQCRTPHARASVAGYPHRSANADSLFFACRRLVSAPQPPRRRCPSAWRCRLSAPAPSQTSHTRWCWKPSARPRARSR